MRGKFIDSDSQTLRWLIYNIGRDRTTYSQLESDELTWRRVANTRWHNVTADVLQSSLSQAIKNRIIQSDGDLLELRKAGQALWSSWFKPNWNNSYAYSCCGSDREDGILNIQISSRSMLILFRVVTVDLSGKEYGHIQPESIRLSNGYFYPLYWKKLKGFTVRFTAKIVSRESGDSIYQSSALSHLRWFENF